MKLLVICPYFFPKLGGMENYILNICKKLIELKKWEIVVVCSYWENGDDTIEFIDGIKVYRLSYQFKISSTPINIFWKSKISRIIDSEKPDVVNGHTPVPFIADIGARISKKKRIPFILTYQNDLCGYNFFTIALSKLYYIFMGNQTLDLSDRIIVSNDYYSKGSPYLQKYRNKINVVSPGVDSDYLSTSKGEFIKETYGITDSKVILFVGQLNKESQHKGLSFLFDAIKIIGEQVKVKLIVIGEGNYVDFYKNLAVSKKISDHIIFSNRLDTEKLILHYRSADLLVLPSYNRAEGFGMVLIEAQACGLPVIGTTVGGIPSAIIDGVTGILVPPKNSGKLAEAMLIILNDEPRASAMGIAGAERIQNEFTWDKSAENFISIINEVI